MTIAYGCILTMMFVPLVLAGYAKFGSKGYDNRNPREFLEKVQGKFKRAHYAQLNAYEAFPPFAAGVLVAHASGAVQSQIDVLAAAFVFFRILYSLFYVIDQHQWRSIVWFLAFLCVIGLFGISF
jgi:uncharacterized MAPEG superfamily protein